MAAKDIDSYRFGRGEEPTDEMLAQIMSEVTETAKQKFDKAYKEYFDNMLRYAEEQKAKWGPLFEAAVNKKD
jgi:hypothetical protein